MALTRSSSRLSRHPAVPACRPREYPSRSRGRLVLRCARAWAVGSRDDGSHSYLFLLHSPIGLLPVGLEHCVDSVHRLRQPSWYCDCRFGCRRRRQSTAVWLSNIYPDLHHLRKKLGPIDSHRVADTSRRRVSTRFHRGADVIHLSFIRALPQYRGRLQVKYESVPGSSSQLLPASLVWPARKRWFDSGLSSGKATDATLYQQGRRALTASHALERGHSRVARHAERR